MMRFLSVSVSWAALLLCSTTAFAQSTVQVGPNGVFIQSGNSAVAIPQQQPIQSVPLRPFYSTSPWFTSGQTQQTALTISSARLKQVHTLSIRTTSERLAGNITVNGKVVKTLKSPKDSINLARYLKPGKNTVVVSAQYAPLAAATQVDLTGPGIQSTQQMSGNGSLNYSLIVTVR